MTPEQIAYQAAQLRQQALTLADKRAPADADADALIVIATKLLAFLQGGGTVATPSV